MGINLVHCISLLSFGILIAMLATQLHLSPISGLRLNPFASLSIIASYPVFHAWYVRKHGTISSRSQSLPPIPSYATCVIYNNTCKFMFSTFICLLFFTLVDFKFFFSSEL